MSRSPHESHPLPSHERLGDKVAVITGSTRSIGRAIAERLAAEGAKVVINDARDAGAVQDVVEEIGRRGREAAGIVADLRQPAENRRLIDETIRRFDRLDIFVANAGVGLWNRPGVGVPVLDVTEQQFDDVFAINTRGLFFGLQAAAEAVVDGGRLINISSSTTVFPNPGFAVYAGSKAAGKAFVEVLAKEVGPRGVTVNSVVMGPTQGGLLTGAAADIEEMLASQSPMGRLGTANDAASIVAFLCSDDAAWVSGQHILANGAATV